MENSEKEKMLQEFRRIRDSIVDKLSSEEINEEIRKIRESKRTMQASQDVLKKDWDNKADERWNDA